MVRMLLAGGAARPASSGTAGAYEALLAAQLDYYGMVYVREYRFAPPRRWRADFYLERGGTRVLVEVEGGRWRYGRHSRPEGFAADAEKYNAAAALGFLVKRYMPEWVENWSAICDIRRVLGYAAGDRDRVEVPLR